MKISGEKEFYIQKEYSEPEYLMIEPTNRCNQKCITCSREELTSIGDMSYENFEYIMNQFSNIKNVKLHGLGEPLLAKDIIRMLEYLKKRNIKVVLVSNLQWKNIDIEHLMCMLEHMYISYHATDEQTYLQICGCGNWELLHRNIQEIQKFQSQTNVQLNFVCNKFNINQIESVVQRAYDLNIHCVRFQIMQNWATESSTTVHDRIASNVITDLSFLIKQLKSAKWLGNKLGIETEIVGNEDFNYTQCIWPFSRMYITWSGEIVPCCMRPNPHFSYGNILKQSLQKIWNGSNYELLREKLKKSYPGEMCKFCPYKELTPTMQIIKNALKNEED